MKQIPFSEFYSLVLKRYPALIADWDYSLWSDSDDFITCYLTGGCAAFWFVNDYNNSVTCNVHEIESGADYSAVCREFYERLKAEDCKGRSLNLFHNGELSEELDKFNGWRVFVREPAELPAAPDYEIAELTRDDAEELKKLCDVQNDTRFGRMESDSFRKFNFDWAEQKGIHLLGCRIDGRLAGVADWSRVESSGIGFLRSILVSPNFRSRGVGKALVLAAVKNLPESIWAYQASRDNLPSIALAKSCGFRFAGAPLCLM